MVDDPRVIDAEYDAGVDPAPSVPVTAMVPPESAIVVEPVKVFAPERVSVPAPCFVRVPLPVVTAATDEVPTPSTVRLTFVPVTPPESVSELPESI